MSVLEDQLLSLPSDGSMHSFLISLAKCQEYVFQAEGSFACETFEAALVLGLWIIGAYAIMRFKQRLAAREFGYAPKAVVTTHTGVFFQTMLPWCQTLIDLQVGAATRDSFSGSASRGSICDSKMPQCSVEATDRHGNL
eukprot:5721862-Amphidinium_carterae.2